MLEQPLEASTETEACEATGRDPEPETAPSEPERIAWDESAGLTPLGFGGDARPLVLDRRGGGRPAVLLTAVGGPRGFRTRLYRPLADEGGDKDGYDGGRPLEALDGLWSLGVLAGGAEDGLDLVGLGDDGLVFVSGRQGPDGLDFGPRTPLGIGPDLGFGPCRPVQFATVDWDGDGLTDLLVGIDDTAEYWPDGDRLPPSQQLGFNQKGGHPGYDPDGLWRGRPPVGRVVWLKNVGTPGAPAFIPQPDVRGDRHPLDVGMHPAPLAVSWHHAGGLELLVTDRRGMVHVYRNFGGQRPPVVMEPKPLLLGREPWLLPEDRTRLVAADLDGDGRDELVLGTSDGHVFAVHAGPGRHDVKPPRLVRHKASDVWVGGHAVLACGDVDGDGGLDLVAGVSTGRLSLFADAGGPRRHRYRPPVTIEAGGAPFQLDPGPDGLLDGPVRPRLGFACPALADWAGHGRLDLVLGGAGGEVVLLRNDGSRSDPRFGPPAPLRCAGGPLITPPRVRPALADWRATGSLDLITLDLQGFLCLYPRGGTHEVGPPIPLVDRLGRYLRMDSGFGLSGGCALWAGDWCGNGLADVLVGLPTANRHVVAATAGLAVDDLDGLPTVLLLENLGRGVLCPRPVYHADGRPLAFGRHGCSPSGVATGRPGGMDLLVGSDDGSVVYLDREALKW